MFIHPDLLAYTKYLTCKNVSINNLEFAYNYKYFLFFLAVILIIFYIFAIGLYSQTVVVAVRRVLS